MSSLRRMLIASLGLIVCLVAVSAAQDRFPPPPGGPEADDRPPPRPRAKNVKRGLISGTSEAFAGHTLFAPLNSTTTYLVDMKGEVAHSWPSRYVPGQAAYLLADGTLLRCAREPNNRYFEGGGIGGRVERIAPDGTVLWEFVLADEKGCLHHDIEPMPNGNILMIAWEKKTRDEAIAAGRDPELMRGDELWPDRVIEVQPQGTRGGRIVWEWHVWDHVVQNRDKNKPNYGAPADHPERVDINYRSNMPGMRRGERRRLRDLGYFGGGDDDGPPEDAGGPPPRDDRGDREAPDEGDGPRRRGPGRMGMQADWCHTNSIAYNVKLDQIVLSVHHFNEIWIIDHGTTTEEAAGHTDGRYGRGGDLLYRWGNPRAYGAGDEKAQRLFAQHDARWIPEGFPGAGNLLIFNNGQGRRDGAYSSVVEIAPPIETSGRYTLKRGRAFGPDKPAWEYAANDKREFFSSHISGAQRLPNGNTLICDGEQGRLFEVTAAGKVVWDYVNPFIEARRPEGDFRPGLGDGDSRPRPRRPEGVERPDGEGPPPRDGPGGPDGPRFGRRPWGAGGPGGFRRPFGPGGPMGGVFRASRLGLDDEGVKKLLTAKRGIGEQGTKSKIETRKSK